MPLPQPSVAALSARPAGRRNDPVARVRVSREQSAIVVEALEQAFASDLEATARGLGATTAGLSPRTFARVRALVERYRDALDRLAWGQASGDVELVWDPSELRRLAGGLLESGYELIGNPEAYLEATPGCESTAHVIRRGVAEAAVGRIILEAVGSHP